MEQLGGLDVAVNNVGSLAGRPTTPFLDADDDYLRDIVEQNLFVTTWCCQAEAAAMVAAGTEGVIVNVSSGESSRPGPQPRAVRRRQGRDQPPHLHARGRARRRRGIRVVAVAPGTTLTPVVKAALDDATVDRLVAAHPLGRLTEPDDLGRLVVALASDLGRAVTGQLVFGDNGAHLSRNRPPL